MKCAEAAIGILNFIPVAPKLISCFGRFSQILKTKFLVETLISQPNLNQISHFMDQNLSWLIVNRKQFQFWKSKIFFTLRSIKQRAFFDSPGTLGSHVIETSVVYSTQVKSQVRHSCGKFS